MDPIFGGALSLGGSLLSGIFGSSAQDSANAANIQNANNQMAFQERMSSTAYQRASTDMQAAGLNPMMMFGSGGPASSPGGASATVQASNPMSGLASVKDAVATASQMKVQNATVDNLVQQNANLKTDNLLKSADAAIRPAMNDAELGNKLRTGGKIVADTNNAIAAGHVVANEATKADNENDYRSTPAGKLMDQAGMAGRQTRDVLSPVATIVSSAKGAKNILSPWDKGGRFDDRFNAYH